MRLVHAVRSDQFAGVERHVAVLARAQADAGHRVTVVGGDPGRMEMALGERVPQVPARTTAEVARALLALRKPDLVHVHMTAAEVAAALVHPLVRRPVIATRHFTGTRGSSLPARAARLLVRRALSAQIAVSQHVADRVDGASVVVYPGVQRPLVVPGVSERRPWVLVAQRLEPEKRTEDAIRAFAEVTPPGWSLVLAGDGSRRPPLEELVRGLGIADLVKFLGHRDDVRDLMAQASVLLAPCPDEGLGLSVLEAMAAGLPVVAADGGGHRETVGRSSPEYLFSPGDWRAAAERLDRLAHSPDLRARAAEAGREVQARRFTVERQVRATDEVYRAVLA